MNRALVVASLFFVSCASARPEVFSVSAAPEVAPPTVESSLPVEPAAVAPESAAWTVAPEERESFTLDPTLVPASAASPAADELRHSRFTLKGGWYGSEEDALDDGWIVGLSWMRFFTHFFALELELGYFDASGDENQVSTDAWGIPLMVNGRLNLPVWVLDLYGGLGVGTIYYDVEAGNAFSDDGFLLAGNAFLGATVNLADAVAVGLEAKYYLTEDISDTDTGLDALALMLTVGMSR